MLFAPVLSCCTPIGATPAHLDATANTFADITPDINPTRTTPINHHQPTPSSPPILRPVVTVASYQAGIITIRGLPSITNTTLQESQMFRKVFDLKRLWASGDRDGPPGYHERRRNRIPLENALFQLRVSPTVCVSSERSYNFNNAAQPGTVIITLLRDYNSQPFWGRPISPSSKRYMTEDEITRVYGTCIDQCKAELQEYFDAAIKIAQANNAEPDFYNTTVPRPFYISLPPRFNDVCNQCIYHLHID